MNRAIRYESLDLWRAIVCLLVVFEHAGVALWVGDGGSSGLEWWFRRRIDEVLHCNLGTTFFFVISGYCVASSIASSSRRGEAPRRFLLRRFFRIYPSYWCALAIFIGVVALMDGFGLSRWHRSGISLQLDSPGRLDVSQWLGNFTLTETWRPHLFGPGESVFTRIGWSLCFQEQFYAISALIWAFAGRRFLAGFSVASVGIVAVALAASDVGAIEMLRGTFFLRWFEFASGVVVYALLHEPSLDRRGRWVGLGTLAGGVFWGAYTGHVEILASASFALILAAMYRWDGPVGASTFLKPIRRLGTWSYSIYLVHLPIGCVVAAWIADRGISGYWERFAILMPAAMGAGVLGGWAFHRLIDAKFAQLARDLKGRTTVEAPAPVASPAVVPEFSPAQV